MNQKQSEMLLLHYLMVCDDGTQSTLHNRVSSFYSSARQIRDNGRSGILTSLATMCQCMVMMRNLGYSIYDWFDKDALSDYQKFKFSHLGYRRICSPITAGLCMSDFENEKFAHFNRKGGQLKLLLKEDLDLEELPE